MWIKLVGIDNLIAEIEEGVARKNRFEKEWNERVEKMNKPTQRIVLGEMPEDSETLDF